MYSPSLAFYVLLLCAGLGIDGDADSDEAVAAVHENPADADADAHALGADTGAEADAETLDGGADDTAGSAADGAADGAADELEVARVAAADAEAEETQTRRKARRRRIRDLDGGTCFYLVRLFKPATSTLQNALTGLNPAWWAARCEGKALSVVPIGTIGGKARDSPMWKVKPAGAGSGAGAGAGSGAVHDRRAAGAAPGLNASVNEADQTKSSSSFASFQSDHSTGTKAGGGGGGGGEHPHPLARRNSLTTNKVGAYTPKRRPPLRPTPSPLSLAVPHPYRALCRASHSAHTLPSLELRMKSHLTTAPLPPHHIAPCSQVLVSRPYLIPPYLIPIYLILITSHRARRCWCRCRTRSSRPT